MFFILAQISSVISLIAVFISLQFKNKNKLLIIDVISSAFYSVSLVLLNAYLGAVFVCIAIVRGLLLINLDKRKASYKLFVLCFISALLIASTILIYENYFSIIFLASNNLLLFGMWQKNPITLRVFAGLDSVVCIIYNVIFGGWVNIILEVFLIISCIIFIIRYTKYGFTEEGRKAKQRVILRNKRFTVK